MCCVIFQSYNFYFVTFVVSDMPFLGTQRVLNFSSFLGYTYNFVQNFTLSKNLPNPKTILKIHNPNSISSTIYPQKHHYQKKIFFHHKNIKFSAQNIFNNKIPFGLNQITEYTDLFYVNNVQNL